MKRLIGRYLVSNRVSLIVMVTALLLGLVLGCSCFENIGNETELKKFLGTFFTTLADRQQISFSDLFRESVLQTAILSGLLFVSGLSLFGIGVVPLLVWYKGFAAGFTSMVFFRLYGIKVIPFVFMSILPSALVWIPFLLVGALESSKMSAYLLECCCKHRIQKRFRSAFLRLCTAMSFSVTGILIAGMIDVFFVPKLLGLISNLYL